MQKLPSPIRLITLFLVWSALGCSDREPAVAPDLDLQRFQGRWYEIARIPRDYDQLCHDTTADYRVAGPLALEMTHTCHIGGTTGRVSQFKAPATADDPKVPAKLSLDMGLYRGDYWVLEVGKSYEFALVGHPSLTMLWVLSRTPQLDADTYGHLLERAQADGFGTNQLVLTPQSSRSAE